MGYSPLAVKTPDVSSSAAKNEDDEKKGKQRKGSSWMKKIISRRFYFTSKVTDSMSSEDEDDILINNPAMDGDNDDDHPHESSLSTFPSSLDLLSEEQMQSGEGSQRSVSFSELHVRQHDVVLGDHPCCYTGLPVTLGWHIREEYSTTIDEFESKRRTERRASREDLRLSEDERRSMLLSLSSSKKENSNEELNTCASHDNEKNNDETNSIDKSSMSSNDEDNYNEQKLRRVERKLCRERRKNRSKYCQRQEETQFFQQKVSS